MCLQESKKVEISVSECLILQNELAPDASGWLLLWTRQDPCFTLKIRQVEGECGVTDRVKELPVREPTRNTFWSQ